ncbi:MAG TPA: A/G-specific adenine glycosylase [Pseudogracilibacillus sp.]|nr:A/G-specific adenine glycosylase [Pseudogracilibacillus sp.]
MPDKSLQQFDKSTFRKDLIHWYKQNRRDLPWRKTTDPYKIWVSEIMLQQTKVDTVIPYYEKFLTRYPTVYALAEADEQDVLKEWEGLGYYSRARNLHTAAKEVVQSYDGKVPHDRDTLATLKGVGPYTRGAILSIAFQQPEPAVDGNVMRVLSRVLFIQDNISDARTRRRFETIVRKLIDERDPSSFNQGLMEIGALICTPSSPKCDVCPLRTYCRAKAKRLETTLPIRMRAKKQRVIHYITLLLEDEDADIAIEQRPNDGLLANMWQFPMIEYRDKKADIETLVHETLSFPHTYFGEVGNVKHVFSHIIWELTVVRVTCTKRTDDSHFTFVPREMLTHYPFSVAHQRVRQFL